MGEASDVSGLQIGARDGVGVVQHGRAHHFDRALAPHLHVLGEVHLSHAPLAELADDVIAIGQHLSDEVGPGRRRAQRLAVFRTKAHLVGVFGRADGTDLHAGSSTRRSLSPTRTRELWRSGMSPRAARATPLRAAGSTTTKSASSERTTACRALIDGSYGKIQSPCSRPIIRSRPGES